MTDSGTLPTAFASLEPFVAKFAVATMAERRRLRLETTAAERATFYRVMRDRLDAILEFLDGSPLDALSPGASRLLTLTLAMAEIARAEEVYGAEAELEHSRNAHFIFVQRELDRR